MSVLRQSSQQVRDTLESMPPQSRLILLAIAVAMILGILFVAQRPPVDTTVALFGGRRMSDHEMDLAEISFSKAGLSEWTRDDDVLLVPIATRHEYLAALENSTMLPTALSSSVQDAIDQTHFFESDSVRHARHSYAKAQDLGNQLAAFDDISWAKVVYDSGKATGFDRKITQSASVVVCPVGDDPLPPARIRTIQQFIRGAYADMSPDDVVVIDKNADDTFAGNTDPVLRYQAEEQARIKYRVMQWLSGYDDLRVSVNVQMDPSPNRSEQESQQGLERGLTTRMATAKEPTTAAKANEDSNPDLLSNLLNAVTRVRGNRSAKVRAPVDATNSSTPALNSTPSIQNVRVSVGLPQSYLQSAVQNRHDDGASELLRITDDQREKIRQSTQQNMEQAIVPIIMAGASRPAKSSVDLWFFPDSDARSLRQPVAATGWPALPETLARLKHTHSAVWGLVGVGLVLMVTSIVWLIRKRLLQRTPTIDPNSVTMHTPTSDPRESLRDELVTLVDTNPDLAAQIIHSWVGKAA